MRVAFSGMAAVAFLVCWGIMRPDAASVVGYNLENGLIMTGLTLGFGTIGKCAMNRMAEHAGLGAWAVRGSH